MDISAILSTLSPDQFSLLRSAFDAEEQYILTLPNNKFVAVHLQSTAYYLVEKKEGCWTYGTRL